ncbi:lim and transglutaminase domain protein ltd-1-like [Ylistrum balloti]|uniref:lim and transglutaminase domain protein ltd-1-like n=1 Tax=Ylistrum balloti TaxID=509963 RepID=UPI002905C56C|nr:lim and transglutaminase domain protein ltd-1-like [Ylistrum balloti]
MLEDLVEWLVKPCKGHELAKLRVLYRWLTSWDIKKFKPPLARIDKGSVLWYILRLQNKQENYASMMCYLCSYAGLVCMVIHGFMKGSTYKIGQSVASNKINMYGEWNAVLIDNVWRHVNAYWGACAVMGDDDEATTFHLDETFFIPDPENLAYTHFPDEPKWQLLDRQMSMKDFEKRAFVKERFFELEMRILSHPECEIMCHDDLEILFGIAPSKRNQIALKCILSVENDEEDWVPVENDKFQHDYAHVHNANSVAVQMRFPDTGTYRLEILGKDLLRERSEEKYIYDWLVVYKIYVKKIGKNTAFPKCDESALWGPNILMEEAGLVPIDHQFATLNADGGYLDLPIKFEDGDVAESEIFYKMTTLQANLDDVEFSQKGIMKEDQKFIIFNDKPPANEYGLCIYIEEEEDPLELPPLRPGEIRLPMMVKKNVCNYMVRCTSLSKDSKFREIDNARKAITDANKEKRLANLERIIDLIETKDFERYMAPETKFGRELVQRLRKLQSKLHEIMILDTETIMKLRDLVNPPPEVFAVMKSLLLFLGHFDEELRQWNDVRKIVGRSAKLALKRRIGEFDINDLDLDIALGAKKLLGTMELEDVRAIDPTLAVFMDYVMAVVEEMELRNQKKLDLTVPRTTREKIERSKKVIALLTATQPKVEPEEEFEEYDFF